jgi:hypothetical protein
MSRGIIGSGTGMTDADGNMTVSRRRPGRREEAHPSLIPLLRGTAGPIPDDTTVIADLPAIPMGLETEEDPLAPAWGIIFGVALSVPIWAVLILGACSLLSVSAVEIAMAVPILAALSFAACHMLD